MTVGTFTLMIWLYVGGGKHQTFYINRLTKADCEALAWEVGRVEMNADTDCHRSGDPWRLDPTCGISGFCGPPLPGRHRVRLRRD